MAKHLGNGFPMGAVAASKEVASSCEKMIGSTYGGNPIAMAAGREVLRVIEEEKMQERALTQGKQLKDGLRNIMAKHEVVGDIRGEGLLVGIEIVTDKESKKPDPDMFNAIHENCKDNGLLMGRGGRYEKSNCFRLQPPMCISAGDVEFALDVIDRSVRDAVKNN